MKNYAGQVEGFERIGAAARKRSEEAAVLDWLRAQGDQGKPAPFSKDNVPYQPKHWLKFADKPLGAGDFVMVAGYPGVTSRYALADEFDNAAGWSYPAIASHYRQLAALVDAAGIKDPDIAVKYASTVRGWENTMKNYTGQVEGFERIGAAERKRGEEAAVLDWLRAQGDKGKPALEALDELVALAADARVHVSAMPRSKEAVKAAPPLTPAIMDPIRKEAAKHFPGVPVIPAQEIGATDAAYLTPAGIPTYGFTAMFFEPDGSRLHGLNERIRTDVVYQGRDMLFDLVRDYLR
jgi:hypothetical protein